MAGIYIHIPFCRQKCYYCDFYKTVNTSYKQHFTSAVKKELFYRKNYLKSEAVSTIYFGGGTPSVLNREDITGILESITTIFQFENEVEITFEANPDDLTLPYLEMLRSTGINRLSIGIQSFQDAHLKKMNRRHNAYQAKAAVTDAAKTGFQNITVDLIYGLPGLTQKDWESDLDEVFGLPVQHISAYHLTYHKGTTFYTWLKKGTLRELSEDESVSQFNLLMQKARDAGFEQYEISNFAKSKLYSRHNSAYWNGTSYLGLGPSAHSYNGISRRWNASNIETYRKGIEKGTVYYEEETLSEIEKYNEYLITRLRTKWGVSLEEIEAQFGETIKQAFQKNIRQYVDSGKIIRENDVFKFSHEGLFVSDNVLANLIII